MIATLLLPFLILSFVASIFFYRLARRNGIRFAWLFIPSILILMLLLWMVSLYFLGFEFSSLSLILYLFLMFFYYKHLKTKWADKGKQQNHEDILDDMF